MPGRSYTLQAIDPFTGRELGPRRVVRPLPAPAQPETVETSSAPVVQLDVTPYPAHGTIDDVLAWVGYDADRAKAATAAEHGRAKPRKSLLRELSERTS